MGFRDTLNKNPQAVMIGTIAITVLALLLVVWQLWPASSSAVSKAYFTIDDGKTFFVDDIYKIPPFKYQGKDAVRAHVYRVGEKGPMTVEWMEKFTPELKAKIEKYYADKKNRGTYVAEFYDDMFKLVKKKGTDQWMNGAMVLQAWRMVQTKDGYASEVYPD
ncbi:MAG TPA: hypothetical protein VHP11_08520 [Tepidisphaeraceae bacterium]|nr:hypothetical protein [Tepidisphaeraceae bacterium]